MCTTMRSIREDGDVTSIVIVQLPSSLENVHDSEAQEK
jgi:hypothetical protein